MYGYHLPPTTHLTNNNCKPWQSTTHAIQYNINHWTRIVKIKQSSVASSIGARLPNFHPALIKCNNKEASQLYNHLKDLNQISSFLNNSVKLVIIKLRDKMKLTEELDSPKKKIIKKHTKTYRNFVFKCWY